MINNKFFSKFLGLKGVPEQNLVHITAGSQAIATTPLGVEIPLIYDDDSVSIKAKSSFDNLADPSSNTLMTLLSATTQGTLPSGQFALQNIQIWKSTDPLELSFNVRVLMADDGYNDVVYPIKQLMKICLPSIAESGLGAKLGGLIPPGPSLKTISELTNFDTLSKLSTKLGSDTEGTLVNLSIGKFHFNNCLITEVSPEFSTTVDENGYPVSAEVGLELKTCMVATQNMVEDMTLS